MNSFPCFSFLPWDTPKGPVEQGYLIGPGHNVLFPLSEGQLVVLEFKRVKLCEFARALSLIQPPVVATLSWEELSKRSRKRRATLQKNQGSQVPYARGKSHIV